MAEVEKPGAAGDTQFMPGPPARQSATRNTSVLDTPRQAIAQDGNE
jgi:hypothetical protein